MPVPLRSTESNNHGNRGFNEIPEQVQLNPSMFAEIIELWDKIQLYKNNAEEDKVKSEKLNKSIEFAKESIAKAEEKQEVLLKRNQFLRTSLDHMEERQRQALEYWKNYGLNIEEIPTGQDGYEVYEFIYSKLPNRLQRGEGGDEDFVCRVRIQCYENILQVTSHTPIILSAEQLRELNLKLTEHCAGSNRNLDYRSAMTLIKKALTYNLSQQQRRQQQQVSQPQQEPRPQKEPQPRQEPTLQQEPLPQQELQPQEEPHLQQELGPLQQQEPKAQKEPLPQHDSTPVSGCNGS